MNAMEGETWAYTSADESCLAISELMVVVVEAISEPVTVASWRLRTEAR